MNKQISELKPKIEKVLRDHSVSRSDVFGSYARGEATKNSDLDILVELKQGATLIDLASLKIALEKDLKRDVDVITYKSLDDTIRPYIYKDIINIL